MRHKKTSEQRRGIRMKAELSVHVVCVIACSLVCRRINRQKDKIYSVIFIHMDTIHPLIRARIRLTCVCVWERWVRCGEVAALREYIYIRIVHHRTNGKSITFHGCKCERVVCSRNGALGLAGLGLDVCNLFGIVYRNWKIYKYFIYSHVVGGRYALTHSIRMNCNFSSTGSIATSNDNVFDEQVTRQQPYPMNHYCHAIYAAITFESGDENGERLGLCLV